MSQPESAVYYTSSKNASWTSKIAAFDLDSTLILPINRKNSPLSTNESDWKFFDFSIPSRLQDLHAQGYTLVIFTNQAGISASDQHLQRFKKKIESIFERLDLPIHLYAALKHDFNRKPLFGMWHKMLYSASSTKVEEWFYVGDAAGRPRDHSDCDLKFAKNIEAVFFKTPEQFFLDDNSIVVPQISFMEPLKLECKELVKLNLHVPCAILLFGPPAVCGRWSFVNEQLKETFNNSPFEYLEPAKNLFAKQEFLKVLNSGISVVLKASFPTAKERSFWIRKANDLNVPVYCLIFRDSLQLEFAQQINLFKGIDASFENSTVLHKASFQKAFSKFQERLEYPSLEEGFTQIIEVCHIPSNPLFGKIFI